MQRVHLASIVHLLVGYHLPAVLVQKQIQTLGTSAHQQMHHITRMCRMALLASFGGIQVRSLSLVLMNASGVPKTQRPIGPSLVITRQPFMAETPSCRSWTWYSSWNSKAGGKHSGPRS